MARWLILALRLRLKTLMSYDVNGNHHLVMV